MREKLGPIAIAILCIVALGLGAATLQTVVSPGQDEGPEGGPEVEDSETESENEQTDQNVSVPEQLAGDRVCDGTTDRRETLPIIVLVSLMYAAYQFATTRNLRKTAVAFVIVFVPLLILILLVTMGCTEPSVPSQAGEVTNISTETPSTPEPNVTGEGGESQESPPISLDFLAPLVLVVAIVVVVVGLAARRTRDAKPTESSTDSIETGVPDSLGDLAGETADRIESASGLENEIYRAWAEMAVKLDVEEPETSTPTEFAQAAAEAGMDREDVDRLTDLFRDVRYGEVAVTPQKEEEAVDVLRRIERRYGETSQEGEQ